ncbi:hypothetical protein [Archangium sp.]|nr:hypothetical protein [Archangium sp.]HYO54265.1 hypothetical protein [Archangium sp.]
MAFLRKGQEWMIVANVALGTALSTATAALISWWFFSERPSTPEKP